MINNKEMQVQVSSGANGAKEAKRDKQENALDRLSLRRFLHVATAFSDLFTLQGRHTVSSNPKVTKL